MAQSVKHLMLDLSSGLNLGVVSSSPLLGYSLDVEPTQKKKKKVRGLSMLFLQSWGGLPMLWIKIWALVTKSE